MPQQEDIPPPHTRNQEPAGDEEYVFRFRLEPADTDKAGYDDALLELVRGQLADLLDAVALTYHGQRVMVDGFRLLREPDKQYDIFP